MRNLQVLIVDDDRDFAEGLADLIESRGHNPIIALNGSDAMNCIRSRHVDVTLMDVRMPGMDGIQTFRAIRGIKPDTMVMMMTAYHFDTNLDEVIEDGAVGVMEKPLDIGRLIGFLDDVPRDAVVLLVDDDPDFAASTKEVLESQGYSVVIAPSGTAAVDRLLNNGVKVVVLDLRMPELNGAEVIDELKERNIDIPVVVVTAHREEEDDQLRRVDPEALLEVLSKPVDPADLLAVLDKMNIAKD